MRICVECEQEAREDGWVFICSCGVSFVLNVIRLEAGYTFVQPEVGLPLEGSFPVVILDPPRLVA